MNEVHLNQPNFHMILRFEILYLQALLERTGYTLDVTTGQRKYGGPPPESVYSGQQPSVGTEVRSRRYLWGCNCTSRVYFFL